MMATSKALLLGAAGLVLCAHNAQAFPSVSDTFVGYYGHYTHVSASQNKAAEDFVKSMAHEGITFLGSAEMSEAQKAKRFRKLLTDSFDMKTIGRFALGRYWRTASADQRNEYQKLFRDMIVEVYSRRFSEYDGQKLEVRSSRGDGKDITVTSFIVSDKGGPEVQVDWRVRHKNGQYKVIDIVVEGVSMALTQRSDFSSVIQRGGGQVSVLIAHLREQ